jgi:hypothetical protein
MARPKLYSIPRLDVYVAKLRSHAMHPSKSQNQYTLEMKSYFLQTQGQVASLREGTYAPVRRNRAGAFTGPHGFCRIRTRPPTTTQKEGQLRSAAKYREKSVKPSSAVCF